jgi:hypothetical protein
VNKNPMGKDTPFIAEGDGETDVEISLIEACGLKYEEYVNNKTILTKELIELHLDELIDIVDRMNHHVEYLIFGILILTTGSRISDSLRQKIIDAADWKYDQENYMLKNTNDKDFLELRKEILIDFQEQVRNYKEGQSIDYDF